MGYLELNLNKVKRAIIIRLMKLFERVPPRNDYHLSQIFKQKIFTDASQRERQEIMLKMSQHKYLSEYKKYQFDHFFGMDLFPLLYRKEVLDLGCFVGGRAVAWAERYQLDKLYGIDIEDNYIEAANIFAKKMKVKAEFVCAKAEKLPFEDEVFDAILSYDVFEHVQDVKQTLLECRRVLKRKGKIFLVFPSYFHPTGHHLSLVSTTPFIHYFFSGKDIVDAYNEIIDERGDEAIWYKREKSDLEAWERLGMINGMTRRKFRSLIKETNWNLYHEHKPALFEGWSKEHSAWNIIRFMINPFTQIPWFDELLPARIVFILEKP